MDTVDKILVQIAVDPNLVADAQSAGLDIGAVTEAALRSTLAGSAASAEASSAERIEQWRREHARAIAYHNEVTDCEGFFGEEWRTF